MLLFLDRDQLICNPERFQTHVVLMGLRSPLVEGSGQVRLLVSDPAWDYSVEPTETIQFSDDLEAVGFVLPLNLVPSRSNVVRQFIVQSVALSVYRGTGGRYGCRTLVFQLRYLTGTGVQFQFQSEVTQQFQFNSVEVTQGQTTPFSTQMGAVSLNLLLPTIAHDAPQPSIMGEDTEAHRLGYQRTHAGFRVGKESQLHSQRLMNLKDKRANPKAQTRFDRLG